MVDCDTGRLHRTRFAKSKLLCLRLFTEPESAGKDVINDEEKEYSENFESDVDEERSEVSGNENDLLNTSGAGELVSLQRALQDAHFEKTGESSQHLGKFVPSWI